MNIKILQLTEGAKQATGITVIIDVFRAFSLEAYLFDAGAEKIFPVGSVDLAYDLKKQNPSMILAGERHGAILPGFDIGNSPSQLAGIDVKDKTVIHTTSAGTQGIANAVGATELLGASLVNASATARYIRQQNPDDVSLVCMGLEALAPTEEDTLCAMYIKSILEGTDIDMDAEIASLRYTSGAKFFDPAQNDAFPEADFNMCTQLDKFDFVMKIQRNQDGIDHMMKYNFGV